MTDWQAPGSNARGFFYRNRPIWAVLLCSAGVIWVPPMFTGEKCCNVAKIMVYCTKLYLSHYVLRAFACVTYEANRKRSDSGFREDV